MQQKGRENMEDFIILKINNNGHDDAASFKEELSKYAVDTFVEHSDLAIEFINYVLPVANFAIAFLALPYIAQYIDKRLITVTFGAFELNNNWKSVLKDICKDPEVKADFIKAFNSHTVDYKGKSPYVLKFYSEIKAELGLLSDPKEGNTEND